MQPEQSSELFSPYIFYVQVEDFEKQHLGLEVILDRKDEYRDEVVLGEGMLPFGKHEPAGLVWKWPILSDAYLWDHRRGMTNVEWYTSIRDEQCFLMHVSGIACLACLGKMNYKGAQGLAPLNQGMD